MNVRYWSAVLIAASLLVVVPLAPARVGAHCDSLDGPVVTAARTAFETGNVNLVLRWVRSEDEPEIRSAFDRASAVRQLSAQAKDLAEQYFFETLVRLHRTGEGAPYSGLKPAGRDLGPAIPAADAALRSGSLEPVVALLTETVDHGVRERFAAANAAKSVDADDVAGGRRYVRAYVEFVHYVQHVYETAKRSEHGDAAAAVPPTHAD